MRTQRKVLQDSKVKSILTPHPIPGSGLEFGYIDVRDEDEGEEHTLLRFELLRFCQHFDWLFSATSSSTATLLTQTSSNLLSQSKTWRAQQYWWALQKYCDISWLTSVKAQRHEESFENILLQKGKLVVKQKSPQVCTSMAAPWNDDGEVAWRAPGCQQKQNLFLIQGDFFNWPSPENVSRLAPPKFAWTGPPPNFSKCWNHAQVLRLN